MTLVYVGHWALFSFASVLFSQQGEIWCIFSFMVEKTIRKLGGQPFHFNDFTALTHPAKIDLNRKWLPKQNTIQNFNIDAQGFRKTRNENPPTWEIGVTS